MGKINNMIKTIKEIHKEDIVMIKIGNFYHAYGKDACLLSYIFNYKLKEENDTYTTGFPINGINKIIANLESMKINYILLDKRNNYEVDQKSDNKSINNYMKYYEKARKQAKYKIKIEKIYDYMQKNISKNECKKIITEVENLINERRKIQSN